LSIQTAKVFLINFLFNYVIFLIHITGYRLDVLRPYISQAVCLPDGWMDP